MIGALASMLGMTAVLSLTLKVTVILACGALIVTLLGGRPAATRHFVWLIALSSVLGLTILTPIVPRLTVSVPAPAVLETFRGLPIGTTSVPATTLAPTAREVAAMRSIDRQPPSGRSLSVAQGFGLVWLAGCLAVLLWSLLGHIGLARLDRAAVPIDRRAWHALIGDGRWRRILECRVRMGINSWVGTPLTWGWPRSVILLPHEVDSWPAERRRVALQHELAHVARRDYVAQQLAMLTCAIYWFHPLAWLAASQLRSEAEHACDDLVLAEGIPASEYASTLLEVARRARALRRAGFAAVAMARPSHLEGRLLAVLDDSRPRGGVPRRAALAALAGAGLLLIPSAGLAPRLVSAGAHAPVRVQAVSTHEAERSPMVDRTIATASGERLRLDLETGGEVVIHGWDRRAVQVRARLGGSDWRDTRVDVEREDGGVVVRATHTGTHHSYSTSHRFEIRVPARYDVKLSSGGGGIAIIEVEGTFRGHTGGGEIVLERDKGSAHLTTGGGEITVTDSELDGSVSTGGGLVRISNVRGGLRGSSGSGPVIESDRSESSEEEVSGDLQGVRVNDTHGHIGVSGGARTGFLRISKAGGEVDLEAAPEGARITTGGGDIRVGRAAGTVDASTGGGDIEIGPVAGSVEAGTGAGAVHVLLTDAGGKAQTVEVKSGAGKVVLELPAHLDARFDLETAYTESFGRSTRIESGWTLKRESTTRWDGTEGTPRRYVRAHGVVGTGRGLIRVRTVNGDIEVRRTPD